MEKKRRENSGNVVLYLINTYYRIEWMLGSVDLQVSSHMVAGN